MIRAGAMNRYAVMVTLLLRDKELDASLFKAVTPHNPFMGEKQPMNGL
jgi:hypothetical protein